MTAAPSVETVRPNAPKRSELLSFFGAIRLLEGRRLLIAAVLLVLGVMTEGATILLFLPVLQMLGDGGTFIDLSEINLPGADLLPQAVPLIALLAVIVTLTAAQLLFNRSKAVYLSDLIQDFTNHFRLSLFRDVAAARWDHVARIPRTRIEHALTGEIERLYLAAYLLLSIMQGLIGLTMYFALSLIVSAPMTLLSYGFGALALLLMRPFRRLAGVYGNRLQSQRQRQSHAVSEFVGSLKMARSMNLEQRYQSLFGGILGQTKAEARQFTRQSTIGSGLFQFAIVAGASLFIWVALNWVQLDLARIAILLLLFMRTAPRFMGVQSSVQQLLVNLPAWSAIRDLQRDLQSQRDPGTDGSTPAPRPGRDIRLDAVTWRFPSETHDAITDLTLTLRAGELTVLTGPSGSGKSTVADIVMGLLQPQHGGVLVDGVRLRPEQLRQWRERSGYVAQEPFLIDGTIRDNLAIAMQTPDRDDTQRMYAALELASAGFVHRLPAGLDTPVGERGSLLSGGERQRISIARALMRDPDVLILDEATSALDWENEQAVVSAIAHLKSKVTVMAITHRPALIRAAAVVYVMDGGRVVQTARPDEDAVPTQSYLGRMTN